MYSLIPCTVTRYKYLHVTCYLNASKIHSLFYTHPLMPKQLGSHKTTPELRNSICEQAATGQPLSQIAALLYRPLCTVQAIVKRGAERGYNEMNPKQKGHQKLIIEDSDTLTSISYEIDANLSKISPSISTSLYPLLCTTPQFKGL